MKKYGRVGWKIAIAAVYLIACVVSYLRGGLLELIFLLTVSFAVLFILLLAHLVSVVSRSRKRRLVRLATSGIRGVLIALAACTFVYGCLVIDRFASDRSLPGNQDRYLVVIIADGASLIQARELFVQGLDDPDDYATAISRDFPNISRYFIQKGAFTANGISVWPSSSIPAHTGIVTGCYPRKTGVMGQRQFSPAKRKYTSYIGLGILSHRTILSKDVKTIGEYFPHVRSVDLLQIANRGCSLYVPGAPSDELVMRRLRQIVDSTSFLSGITKRSEIPRMVVMTLPDIDHVTHNSRLDDAKSIRLYRQMDRYVGEIMDLYKHHGIFDKTLFVLAADHGMGEVQNHVTIDNVVRDMRFDSFESFKWTAVPAWGSFEANAWVGTRRNFDRTYNAVPLWGGNSDGLVYIKGQLRDTNGRVTGDSWGIRPTEQMLRDYHVGGTDIDVIQRLLDYSPGVGLVLTNTSPDTFDVHSRQGHSRIRERRDAGRIFFHYTVVSGQDPLGFSDDPVAAACIKRGQWLSDEQSIGGTYLSHYPDALRRIAYSFGSRNSGTAHLVSADGWDFTPYYVSKEVSVGSHGSLNSQQSLVPVMFYGPGIRNVELPYARTVDILPTVLRYFGVKGVKVDGRVLPVFADSRANDEGRESDSYLSSGRDIADAGYYYQLEDVYASYDKRLVRYSKSSGRREVLFDSIKHALPNTRRQVNITVRLIGIDSGRNVLVLREVLLGQNQTGLTYEYDPAANRFRQR